MLESIEGKRGLPRHKPPYPVAGRAVRPPDPDQQCRDAVLGARHRREGAGLVRGPGPQRPQGAAQLFGLGPGQEPGVKLAPAGITARELIDEYLRRHGGRARVQGLSAGRRLGRHIAGEHGRPAARFRHARSAGRASSARPRWSCCRTRTICRTVALNLLRFFEDESCGQCTPCRVGTEKAVMLMNRPRWDEALLDDLRG